MVECSRCARMIDARSTIPCGICSALLCDFCFRETHGLCDDCAEYR